MRPTHRVSRDDLHVPVAQPVSSTLQLSTRPPLPRSASESDADAWLGHLGPRALQSVRQHLLQRVVAQGSTAILPPKPAWLPLPAPEGPSAPRSDAPPAEGQELIEWTRTLFAPGAQISDPHWIHTRQNRSVLLANLSGHREGAAPEGIAVKWYHVAAQPQLTQVFAKEQAWVQALGASGATPRCLASDEARGLMVLQQASGNHIHTYDLQQPAANQVARNLARLHATPLSQALAAKTPTVLFPWSIERWLPFVQHLKLVPERSAQRIQALQQRIEARLQQEPAIRTMIHGDPQLGNILFADDGEVTLIDFEHGYRGDPMFDLAFFATSSHLDVRAMLTLLPSYHDELERLGQQPQGSDETRLVLYGAYQTLFRHVASHKEYLDGDRINYQRWLFHAHSHLGELDSRKLLDLSALGAQL